MLWLVPVCFFIGCGTTDPTASGPRPPETLNSLAKFARHADAHGSVISLPVFETSPEGVMESVSNAIARANAALDILGSRPAGAITFENTIKALDDISYQASLVANRVYLTKETSTNAAVRAAATEAIKDFEAWSVGLDYREDVYAAVQAFTAAQRRLEGEDLRFYEQVLRDYKRAGLHLPKAEREEVERLRKELSRLSTDFDSHITKATRALAFSSADLEGVPESFLSQEGVKTGDDQYTVMANVTWHYVTVMENARKESTRKRL
jgi:Zn-dependent oligopeptidase